MANKRRAPRKPARKSSFYRPQRYDQRSLRDEREYGIFWYAWLWKILRPAAIFLCAMLLVIGMVTVAWDKVYEKFLMPTAPESTEIVPFTIESGTSIAGIGDQLVKAKLLRNGTVFRYLVQFRGEAASISYGTYDLSPSMDVNAIIDELASGSQNAERTITIIPGWTIEDIADYLLSEGVIKDRDEFLNLCKDATAFADISYPLKLAQDLGTLGGRKYQLEGYLAPDTYRIFRSATAQSILNTLIEQTNVVYDKVFFEDNVQYYADEEGNYHEVEQYKTPLTNDQTIILASMIEKEAGKTSDYARVSAVFHNRLNSGWRLDSDPTATYTSGVEKLALTAAETQVVDNYNTYVLPGLPIGPICNPSAAAIEAALFPDLEYIADGYMYFCAKEPTSGELAFAKTEAEHSANVAKYRPLWEEYDRKKAAGNAGN